MVSCSELWSAKGKWREVLAGEADCEGLWRQVPEGHVWLQGDNTLNSSDSRAYGPVPYALLRGRAFARFRVSSCPLSYGMFFCWVCPLCHASHVSFHAHLAILPE